MPNYVQKRASGYYLRYVIPKSYRHLLIQRELRYPLRVHEHRAATQRANIAVAAIERLLDAVRAGVVQLNQEELKCRLRAYVDEQRQCIEDERLERRTTEAIRETHESVVVDLLEQYTYALDNADYRRVNTKALAEFIGVPEEQAVNDAEYARARRDWTRAWIDLLRYQLELLRPGGELLDERPAAEPVAPTVTAGTRDEPQKDTRTLADWLPLFIEAKTEPGTVGKDGVRYYEQAVQDFTAVVGSVPAVDLTLAHVTQFMRGMRRLPGHRNTNPKYKGKTYSELLELEIPEEDLYAVSTINQRLDALSIIMERLRNAYGVACINPFKGMKIQGEATQREVYTDADLQQLFSSELWVPDSDYGRKTGTAAMWWLPLLGLFTGARLGELIQLPLHRVGLVDGVYCFDLRHAIEDGLKIKSKAGRRLIPIHARLLDLGLSDYADAMRADGAKRLLEAFPLGVRTGSKASDWYTKYRDTFCPQFKGENKVFHSFRHTHVTEARDQCVPNYLLKQWIGHSPGKDDVTEGYNAGQGVAILLAELNKLSWDVPALNGMQQGWRELPRMQRQSHHK